MNRLLAIFENCNHRHLDSPLYYIICTTVDRINLHIIKERVFQFFFLLNFFSFQKFQASNTKRIYNKKITQVIIIWRGWKASQCNGWIHLYIPITTVYSWSEKGGGLFRTEGLGNGAQYVLTIQENLKTYVELLATPPCQLTDRWYDVTQGIFLSVFSLLSIDLK